MRGFFTPILLPLPPHSSRFGLPDSHPSCLPLSLSLFPSPFPLLLLATFQVLHNPTCPRACASPHKHDPYPDPLGLPCSPAEICSTSIKQAGSGALCAAHPSPSHPPNFSLSLSLSLSLS
eukprot:RCo033497